MLLTTERFRLEGREIDFDLERKKSVRRNIHIRFEDDGRMRVSAPLRSSKKSIHVALSGMHDQIAQLRREVRERSRDIPSVRYRQGAQHLYLGRRYPLEIWRGCGLRPLISLRSDRIEVQLGEWGEEAVRDALLAWYRCQAAGYFSMRILQVAARARWLRGVPFELRLRRMKRSWGTCSSGGTITLNPLLIKAPPPYIDYVMAHELCHLRQMNHSADFYRLLERLIPNWQTLRNALNERSHIYLRW